MKNKIQMLLIPALVVWSGLCWGQQQDNTDEADKKIAQALNFQQGEITLSGGIAKLNVPPDFRYLNPDDTEKVLVKLWHNPPSEKSLGMLMPTGVSPLDASSWAVVISYADDGYVKDNDAGKIDYSKLLKDMQKSVHELNKERTEKGYPAMELVGWAEPPRYDAEAHKLYWAKELKVEGADSNSLNYNIRMLGRRGVLVLNAIAGMEQLAEVKKSTPQILSMVNFNEGHRYSDFDPKIDKVAAYGLTALVAGGVAAKLGLFKIVLGFFKPILIALVAAKKLVIVGVIAVGVFVKKLFGKKAS